MFRPFGLFRIFDFLSERQSTNYPMQLSTERIILHAAEAALGYMVMESNMAVARRNPDAVLHHIIAETMRSYTDGWVKEQYAVSVQHPIDGKLRGDRVDVGLLHDRQVTLISIIQSSRIQLQDDVDVSQQAATVRMSSLYKAEAWPIAPQAYLIVLNARTITAGVDARQIEYLQYQSSQLERSVMVLALSR